MKLRNALRTMLAAWEDDLPVAWRAILSGTELNFASRSLDHEMRPGEIVLPGRKGAPVALAPEGAHVFRALNGLPPDHVRAVVLGQDPYPNPGWATGRAFEQGSLADWPDRSSMIADSLRRIVQVLASARSGNQVYSSHNRACTKLVRDVHAGIIDLEPPRAYGRDPREALWVPWHCGVVPVWPGRRPGRGFALRMAKLLRGGVPVGLESTIIKDATDWPAGLDRGVQIGDTTEGCRHRVPGLPEKTKAYAGLFSNRVMSRRAPVGRARAKYA